MPGIALVALLLALLAPLPAQQKPNFSGRWVQLSPSLGAGSEQVVEQTEATLTTTHDSEGGGHRFAYRLDGSDTTSTLQSHGMDIVTVSKANWNGNRLTITSTSTYTPERKLEQTFVWSIDEKGQLVVDLTQTMTGRATEQHQVIYRKR